MSTIVLSTEVSVESDGTIDEDSAVSAFRDTLRSATAGLVEETAAISGAVEAVLTANLGKKIGMDFLVSSAVRELNAQPENHKSLGVKVRAFVQDNSCGLNKDGTPKDDTKRYHLAKGRGPGVCRLADLLAAKAAAKPAAE